uniref:Lipocalin-3 1 n=1 Tax=Amblyomma parvum TaxID=251391 RepID=A0A023FVS7_AMBPA
MYFILAFAFLLPSVHAISEESDYGDVPTLRDVIAFFNTTEKIWVYTSSEGPERQCQSIKKISEKKYLKTYKFEHKYFDNTGTHSQTLAVRLTTTPSGRRPRMAVTIGKNTTQYTPRKFLFNEQCGIFSFNRPGKVKQCEMYVWDYTARRTTPLSCSRALDVVCEGLRKYLLYSSSCP